MSHSPLFFVHVPKTGGTTLRHILRKEYGKEQMVGLRALRRGVLEDSVRSKTEEIERARLLQGHMIFGAHDFLLERRPYVAFVRDGVDRVISDYYYVCRTPSHDFYDPVVTEDYSLEDYVRSGITIYTNNLQTRMLAGVGRDVPFGECTDAMLEQAIQNIEEHFPVVGTTDRFEESVVLMKRRFDWGIPLYKTWNRTSNRPDRDEVSGAVRETIRAYNQLDLKLYQYAADRLEAQLADEDPDAFQHDLRLMRLVNAVYGPGVGAYVWMRKTYNQLLGQTTW